MIGPRVLGLRGTAVIEITGACPEDLLCRLADQGVRFRDYRKQDMLTARLRIPLEDLETAKAAARRTMCDLEVLSTDGFLPTLGAMRFRLLLPVVLALLLGLVWWLQGHILFFQVAGNETLPAQTVLEGLEQCGVSFFTPWDRLDLNLLKNQMLSRVPELGFVTVNQRGCVAEVEVRPREEKPVLSEGAGPANILAAKAGLITSVTVTGGTAQVKPGQLVTEGQLLISGVTDLDQTVMLSRARGEVYARTWERIQAVTPRSVTEKHPTGRKTTVYGLTLGKKTIKFCKTSGISYRNYDKMTSVKPLTLPGGYQLPLALDVTVFREYEPETAELPEPQAQELLTAAVRRQLAGTMVAGELLNLKSTVARMDDRYVLTGTAECQQEIGVAAEIKD